MLHGLMKRVHQPIYEHRLRVLGDLITPLLKPNDLVLDVGCGNGTLGQHLLSHAKAPAGLRVEGLERVPRGGEPIKVHAYDGRVMPLADRSVDVVIVADVLHHEPDEMNLLRECRRVSKRLVIVKDHVLQGFLAKPRVSLIDWAANAPHGVPCLYRYHTLAEWRDIAKTLGAKTEAEYADIDLYPAGWNALFGKRLQYVAAWNFAGDRT